MSEKVYFKVVDFKDKGVQDFMNSASLKTAIEEVARLTGVQKDRKMVRPTEKTVWNVHLDGVRPGVEVGELSGYFANREEVELVKVDIPSAKVDLERLRNLVSAAGYHLLPTPKGDDKAKLMLKATSKSVYNDFECLMTSIAKSEGMSASLAPCFRKEIPKMIKYMSSEWEAASEGYEEQLYLVPKKWLVNADSFDGVAYKKSDRPRIMGARGFGEAQVRPEFSYPIKGMIVYDDMNSIAGRIMGFIREEYRDRVLEALQFGMVIATNDFLKKASETERYYVIKGHSTLTEYYSGKNRFRRGERISTTSPDALVAYPNKILHSEVINDKIYVDHAVERVRELSKRLQSGNAREILDLMSLLREDGEWADLAHAHRLEWAAFLPTSISRQWGRDAALVLGAGFASSFKLKAKDFGKEAGVDRCSAVRMKVVADSRLKPGEIAIPKWLGWLAEKAKDPRNRATFERSPIMEGSWRHVKKFVLVDTKLPVFGMCVDDYELSNGERISDAEMLGADFDTDELTVIVFPKEDFDVADGADLRGFEKEELDKVERNLIGNVFARYRKVEKGGNDDEFHLVQLAETAAAQQVGIMESIVTDAMLTIFARGKHDKLTRAMFGRIERTHVQPLIDGIKATNSKMPIIPSKKERAHLGDHEWFKVIKGKTWTPESLPVPAMESYTKDIHPINRVQRDIDWALKIMAMNAPLSFKKIAERANFVGNTDRDWLVDKHCRLDVSRARSRFYRLVKAKEDFFKEYCFAKLSYGQKGEFVNTYPLSDFFMNKTDEHGKKFARESADRIERIKKLKRVFVKTMVNKDVQSTSIRWSYYEPQVWENLNWDRARCMWVYLTYAALSRCHEGDVQSSVLNVLLDIIPEPVIREITKDIVTWTE